MNRKNISSGSPWEDIVGYSRAVRVDNTVLVAGTTAVDEAGEIQGESAYEQTKYALEKIERALNEAGAMMKHVVRTRIFVTNINHWEEVGRAHGEFFKSIRPAATMVEVSALISEDMLVEIEVEAIITG